MEHHFDTCGVFEISKFDKPKLSCTVFDVYKTKNYIRIWITIFKIFIWGSISWSIRLGIHVMLYGSADELPYKISDHIFDDIAPKIKILNTVIEHIDLSKQCRFRLLLDKLSNLGLQYVPFLQISVQ